jgi:lipoprotein-releasing system permease protein
MLNYLPVFIGLRYTRSRKKNHFVSFISLSSMLGIALGVMVLITVLSVMNGFDLEIHKRFFGMAPEITVNAGDGQILDWARIEQTLLKTPGVKAVSPFVGSQGLLTFEGQISPVVLMGVDFSKEEAITHLRDKLILGRVDDLPAFSLIIGRTLAENLGLMLGDQVTLMIPEAGITPAGMIPRFKRFTVRGIFSAGSGFGFENKLAFVNLSDAQKLLRMQDAISGFKLKIYAIYEAPKIADQLARSLGESYQVGNWTNDFGAFFQAVKMEKNMMFLILTLIIAVAAFNLVSSLVMVVNDKQADIAILRTMGATPNLILQIFMVQGMMVGVIGTGLGLVCGILLAHYATEIVSWLQALLHVDVFSSNLYWVDYLPSKIMWSDLFKVCGIALLMSFLATIYPAWRASRTVIAEALHYE